MDILSFGPFSIHTELVKRVNQFLLISTILSFSILPTSSSTSIK